MSLTRGKRERCQKLGVLPCTKLENRGLCFQCDSMFSVALFDHRLGKEECKSRARSIRTQEKDKIKPSMQGEATVSSFADIAAFMPDDAFTHHAE